MIFYIQTTGVEEVMPNRIDFTFTFNEQDEKYDNVVEKLAESVIAFNEKIEQFINSNEMKTKNYSIEIQNKRVEKGTFNTTVEWVFSHYLGTQIVKASIPYDKIKLFDIINIVSQMDNGPKVRFVFSVDNKVKNLLEELATDDALTLAQRKAESIAKHIKKDSVELVEVKIGADFNTMHKYKSATYFEAETSYRMSSEEMAQSMEPEEVTVSVTANCKFDIK